MSTPSTNTLKIVALSAGLSENSTTTRLARQIAEAAATAAGADVDVVELRPYVRDIAEAMAAGFPSEPLERVFRAVEAADALVVATPVYNAMPSGLFVEFFDVLPEGALSGMPVAIAATGGTPRHSLVTEQIRPMLVYLHALVPTTAVYAATEDWGAPGAGYDGREGSSLQARIQREGRELAALARSTAGDETNGDTSAAGDSASGDLPDGDGSDGDAAAGNAAGRLPAQPATARTTSSTVLPGLR